jgi:imidazolonepropionase-like amidohydrolase
LAARADPTAAFRGAYVLPGLVDLHTHLPPDNAIRLTPYFALLYLAHGVTAIRDVGDVDGTAVPAARTGIASGAFPGPRIAACGPFVAGGPPRWTNTIVVDGAEAAAAAVASIKAAGFECVKSYDDLDTAEIRAIVTAASALGLPVLGHVPAALAYEEALVPEVQHFHGVPEPRDLARDHVIDRIADWQDVDDERLDVIVRASLDHGIVNTPTLVSMQRILGYADHEAMLRDPMTRLMPRLYRDVVWSPTEGIPAYRGLSAAVLQRLREAYAKRLELVRRLHAAGAEIRIGTDVQQPFVAPGASVHEEMRLFAAAGIPIEDVWAIATWKAGQTLGIPDLGRLVPGAPADLLVFREDPSGDLEALDTLEAVVADGRLYARADLEAAAVAHRARVEGVIFDRLSVALARRAMRRTIHRAH